MALSDESQFQLFRAEMVGFECGAGAHEAMNSSCEQGTVQAGGGSVMVWGVFTCHGLGLLIHSTTSLTSGHYVELLGDHLQPFMDFMYPSMMGYSSRIMHPCHWAQVVQN